MTPTLTEKAAILEALFKDRLVDIGYGPTNWSRVRNQRYRAKLALRLAKAEGRIKWEGLSSRWKRTETGMEYVPGQSANEELTNEMRQLVTPGAKWMS